MPRRSRPWGRPSSTSPPIAEPPGAAAAPDGDGELRRLVDALPAELRRAVFTHGSWVEQRGDSYERLEFLGDSVLGLAIARHLFERFPDWPEGELARTRQVVVSRDSCAAVARRLRLVSDLVAEGRRRGIEDLDGPARSRAVAAALVEAAIGAVFLHVGHAAAARAVIAAFADRVDYAVDAHVDYKTVLQESLARQGASVTYRLVETSGPPHRRRFTTAATVGDRDLGVGSGASKKASEQAAAREALHGLGELA